MQQFAGMSPGVTMHLSRTARGVDESEVQVRRKTGVNTPPSRGPKDKWHITFRARRDVHAFLIHGSLR